ncbi:GNAT family N-acetyltransferase [Bacillus sp. KH172YL63]|uniref:GNAT family N-acetyltransferase n=1 Tax=Bacillus sp. KH172YL63 TaxID=2709784 RepID=UPI0013E4FC11|nr:GNAT family N-acetyltransferase [Bacillus sp. KH172YL63]BCB02475.1 N-acetyltransferase [Bacillus sp. KH172YL63]
MKHRDLTIETPRLVIRPFTNSDYGNWIREHMNRLPSQHKYDVGFQDMRECTEFWFRDMLEKQEEMMEKDEVYILGIFLKEGPTVGTIDFSTLMRYNFHWGRAGYTVHNTYWNRGYGKEAMRAALQLAFTKLGYHRIEAHINLDNTPSIKLAESIGMQYECTRKGFIYEFGKWTDNLVYYANAGEND